MEDTVFCGVFDGHGPYGHVVAKKVRDCFPLKIMEEWNLRRRGDDDDDKTNNNNKDGVLKMMRELFLMASKFVDKELKLRYAMESFGSGTTAVTLFKKVSMLFHFDLCHFHTLNPGCIEFVRIAIAVIMICMMKYIIGIRILKF